MNKANDIQVGGTHYRNDDQHWDLAAELELGYFEGQITKYITRHRFKKGLEDALKAKHFVTKLYELAEAGKHPQSTGAHPARIVEYALNNKLSDAEMSIVYFAVNWSNPDNLVVLASHVEALIRAVYPHVLDPDGPGPGYVNQG
jgi:hypothetical protein